MQLDDDEYAPLWRCDINNPGPPGGFCAGEGTNRGTIVEHRSQRSIYTAHTARDAGIGLEYIYIS